jgi:large subunit ribosomal protein L5
MKKEVPGRSRSALMKSPVQERHAYPRIEKIVVSVGCGDCRDNAKALDAVIRDITTITGQKAVATIARKSVANFKLREGMKIGVKVTCSGPHLGVPRQAPECGAAARPRLSRHSAEAFDGRGNYSLGVKEQIIFPEIDYDKIEKLRGMNIAICTTAASDEEARELLKLMGAPFMNA